MTEKIKQYISNLEINAGIRVLLAVESGSRSWGFPSANSDFDVRIIYAHRPEWYLQVSEHRDTIEYMSDDRQFDLSGWDLRKALLLMSKTNPSLSDWIFSDIVYHADMQFLREARQLHDSYYNPISALHHFRGLARNFRNSITDGDGVTAKKYLYFLRSVLNCDYILRHEKHPPVSFQRLVDSLGLPINIASKLHSLIERKYSQSENDSGSIDKELIDFAIGNYDAIADKAATFKPYWKFPEEKLAPLDELAIKFIK